MADRHVSPAFRQRVVRLALELCDAIEEEHARNERAERAAAPGRAAPRPAVTKATDTQRAFARRVLGQTPARKVRS